LNETQAEPARLTAYDFAAGLLAGLARRGVTHIVPPELDDRQLTDAAAAAAWLHMESHFSQVFSCLFCVYPDRIYRDSPTWRDALHECGVSGLVTPLLRERSLELELSALARVNDRLPGDLSVWDELARVFVDEIERARSA
jgi:hypothetical protein